VAEYMPDNCPLVRLLTATECAFESFASLLDVDRQVKYSERVAVNAGLITPDSVDSAREHARYVFVGIFAVQAPEDDEFVVYAQWHPECTRWHISILTVVD